MKRMRDMSLFPFTSVRGGGRGVNSTLVAIDNLNLTGRYQNNVQAVV